MGPTLRMKTDPPPTKWSSKRGSSQHLGN